MKRALPSPMGRGEAYISGKGTTKKKRQRRIDLTDVPQLQPIPKSKGRMKEGASQYTGVTFHKSNNKWRSEIEIDGKKRHIGYYKNEEEAAADYARAKFKYKDKGRVRTSSGFVIDLSDVPPQLPIPKSKGRMKEGASKYAGVYFNKQMNKWYARIFIDGKSRHIGCYENEEEAAADYARAVFKYKGAQEQNKARQRKEQDTTRERNPFMVMGLCDAPPQPRFYS